MADDARQKIKDTVRELQLSAGQKTPEQNGVKFQEAEFFNPTTGKNENLGDISEKDFKKYTDQGYILRNYKKGPTVADQSYKDQVKSSLNPIERNTQELSKAWDSSLEGVSVNLNSLPDMISKEKNKQNVENSMAQGIDELKLGNAPQEPVVLDTLAEQPIGAPMESTPVNSQEASLTQQPTGQVPSSSNVPLTGSVSISRTTHTPSGLPAVGGTNAFKQEQTALDTQAQNEGKVAQDIAKIKDADIEKQRLFDEKQAERKKVEAEALQKRSDTYSKAVDDFSQMSIQKPDIWASRTTAGKILLGLGLFLGAAPNSSGQNLAAQAVEKEIDRDIEQQKMELAKKEKGLSYQRSLLTDMQDVFKNNDLAELATRNVSLNLAKNQIDSLTANSQSQRIKDAAGLAKSKIAQEQADYNLKAKGVMIDQYRAETDRLQAQAKANQVPKTPFMEELDKKTAENFAKDVQGLPNIQAKLDNSKQAWSLLKTTETGPIAGSGPVAWARKIGNKDVQLLDNLLSKDALETVKQMAQNAGARSVDSDAEKKFLMLTTPGINKDKPVIENILLASNAVAKRNQLDTQLKQQYLNQGNQNLNGYVSPLENAKTYYKPATGEVDFFLPGKAPAGYAELSPRLEGSKPTDENRDNIGTTQYEKYKTPNGSFRYRRIK